MGILVLYTILLLVSNPYLIRVFTPWPLQVILLLKFKLYVFPGYFFVMLFSGLKIKIILEIS